MHLSALTNEIRNQLHVGRDVHGVVITGIEEGSIADDLGLARGDIIQAINQQPVRTPKEAAEKLKEVQTSPRKNALLLLNRRGVTQYVGINLSRKPG
jgi:serine protease Do